MSQFGILDAIAERIPRSFNDLFSWETYTRLKDPITSNVPIIGENPLRFTTNAAWHRKIPEKDKKTRSYQMQEAICDNNLKKVKEIIDSGFSLESKLCRQRGLDSVHLASILDRPLILKYLILRGGNIEGRDKEGNTPLMSAVNNWQFETIQVLVENGASLNALDKYGKNCMEKARDRSLVSIAQYLEFQSQNREGNGEYPGFGVKFKFESFFDDEEKIVEDTMFFGDGTYYPFNSISGSYLVDSVGILDFDCLED